MYLTGNDGTRRAGTSVGDADRWQCCTVGVVVTWQQKNRADRRSEWWTRTQRAFERTFTTDYDQAELGWKLLSALVSSTEDDFEIVRAIAEHAALSGPWARGS